MTRVTVICPACFDGSVFARCESCGGSGWLGDEVCSNCAGAGEFKEETCNLCRGSGSIAYQVMLMSDADAYIRRQSPDWSGDDSDVRGVTAYSLAKWWRQRDFVRPAVAGARGELKQAPTWESLGVHDRPPAQAVVALLDKLDRVLVEFWGFAWGYRGTGPRGLAAVLADAMPHRFPSYEEALAWVAARARTEAWELS